MLGRLDFYNDMLNYWTIPLLVAFFIFFMGCVWGWYGNSASLASLTRETGPKVVKGDPARKAEGQKVAHSGHSIHDTFDISDSALKFTHVLYNLSPAGIFLYLSLSLSLNIVNFFCFTLMCIGIGIGTGYGPFLFKWIHDFKNWNGPKKMKMTQILDFYRLNYWFL